MQSNPLQNRNNTLNEEQAREGIRIHSFLLPQTRQNIEHYVSSLLSKEEEAICNMATD